MVECLLIFIITIIIIHRDLQTDFRNRVLKELKLALRHAEKLRERYSQKLLKFTKSLQEKRSRSSVGNSKIVADNTSLIRNYVDKQLASWNKDMFTYIKSLQERINVGHDTFYGIEVSR